MPPRPQRVTRPTSTSADQSVAVNTTARPSPKKRKAIRDSSPEVEILEGTSAPSTPSPTKTRTRPSARGGTSVTPSSAAVPKPRVKQEPAAGSPQKSLLTPSTPSKSRISTSTSGLRRPEQDAASTPNRPAPSSVARRLAAKAADMALSSEDEDMGVEAYPTDISDPEFFEDSDREQVVEKPTERNSDEEYWEGVDSVHESNMNFIDDSAVVDDHEDVESDIEMQREAARILKGKGKIDSSPEGVDAKQRSDVKSSDVFTLSPPKTPSADRSKRLLTMGRPTKISVNASEKLDKGVAYLEDIPMGGAGIRGQLKAVFEFRECRHIRNASRTIPANLSSKAVPGGNCVLIAAGSNDTVIQFATLIFLTEESKLYSSENILGDERRVVRGVPQIVEWERMQAVLCMAYRIPGANINMRGGVITFCTAKSFGNTPYSATSSPAKNPAAFFKKVPVAGMSPFTSAKPAAVGTETIPVLDARGHSFNLQGDLMMLDKKLPVFDEEIPQGSCVWVGYTCTKYEVKDRPPGINFNLMWAVVLGTP
ncbi:hypothetical protein HWV62_21074 [Athelia sp. TMB]|nr:hypothetical protein HWV62_21074 [Athelia sp. TMB]